MIMIIKWYKQKSGSMKLQRLTSHATYRLHLSESKLKKKKDGWRQSKKCRGNYFEIQGNRAKKYDNSTH